MQVTKSSIAEALIAIETNIIGQIEEIVLRTVDQDIQKRVDAEIQRRLEVAKNLEPERKHKVVRRRLTQHKTHA